MMGESEGQPTSYYDTICHLSSLFRRITRCAQFGHLLISKPFAESAVRCIRQQADRRYLPSSFFLPWSAAT